MRPEINNLPYQVLQKDQCLRVIHGQFIRTIIHSLCLVSHEILLRKAHQIFARLKELEAIRANSSSKLLMKSVQISSGVGR